MSEKMDVIIAYSVRPQTPKNYEDYFNKNIKLIRVKNFTQKLNPLKDIKAIFEVKQIIKNEKPDIVHMHSSKAGGIGRLAILSKKIKLYYTPHSYAFCKKDESKLMMNIYKFIEKMLGKKKCMTIACSKGEYEASTLVTKNSMYINNGIDINDIEKYIKNEQETKFIDTKNIKICTVGRIDHQKNPELFNKIAEKFPDIQFIWVGDGKLRNVLKSSNIEVLGWCEREEAIKQLQNNDVFILPSLWEGLPITLLEAMYLKKICIVSNIIGNKDVINNKVDGFICDTEEDFFNVIEKIKNNEYDIEKIRNNARDKILTQHNMNKISEEYFKVYCEGDDCY